MSKVRKPLGLSGNEGKVGSGVSINEMTKEKITLRARRVSPGGHEEPQNNIKETRGLPRSGWYKCSRVQHQNNTGVHERVVKRTTHQNEHR